MKMLTASWKNEWTKLMSRKKYIVFLCIGLGLYLLVLISAVAFTNMMARVYDYNAVLPVLGAMTFRVFLSPTPMGVLPFFLQIFLPFLMFMGLADLITTENSENTMKAMLCRPVERWKLYSAKILAVMSYVTLYLMCLFILSAVLNQIFLRPLSAASLLTAFGSYAVSVIPLTVLALFAALIALMSKSSTLVMFLLLISYLSMNVLPVLFPILGEMLFTSYLGWHSLWFGAFPGMTRLVHMLLIVIGYGVAFFSAGSLLFDRKDY